MPASPAALPIALAMTLIAGEPPPAPAPPPPVPKPAPVAVVELFTSEGCNSCPPAEMLAAQLAREARAENCPVFVLAFHIDYWDDLGWPDRFASPRFTARQREYARALGPRAGEGSGVYTPQMVINGAAGLVGSDRAAVHAAIEAALAAPAPVRLVPSASARPPGEPLRLTVRFTHDGRTDVDLVLNGAIVEDGLVSEVTRGENAGVTLRHDRVVRSFASASVRTGIAVQEAGLMLPVPEGLVESRARIVVYAQDTRKRIVGAAELPLTPQSHPCPDTHPAPRSAGPRPP